MDVADVLKAIRARHGWSQRQLADALDEEPHNVSRWEAGGRTPRGDRWEKIRRLAAAEGVLDGGEGMEPAGHIASPLDPDILAEAIARVETWLAERRMALPPHKKADIVALVYEEATAEGADRAASDRRIARILRLLG